MTDAAMAQSKVLDSNLFELFRAQAELTPNAIAVVSEQGSFSYCDLLADAHKIMLEIGQLELSPMQPVGVCMRRSGQMIATMLGILGSGAAYVPMDPDSPPERLRRIVDNAKCSVVLGDQASARVLKKFEGLFVVPRFIEIDSVFSKSAAAAKPPSAPGGDRRAYIIYTSGSTGEPKGVDIAHRGVVNLLLAMRERVGFGAEDRILAAATIGFDVSVVEIFLPLISGGSLLLRDRHIWLTPDKLVRDIERYQVTVIQTSPTTWSMLLEPTNKFPRVRVAMNLGEAIPVSLAKRLITRADHVWNLYGPTEGSVYVSLHNLTTDSSLNERSETESAPIGHTVANVSTYILDTHGDLVGPGIKGELCVGGIAPARGYFNDEPLTREKFRIHSGLGERLYHTGDLAARSETGLLTYFGRIDDQLKIRGMRIEPGEVEAALLTHSSVNGAAVTWYENPDGFRSMVAAIVGKEPDADALRGWLESRLPPQMIPSRFVFVAAIPKAATGKVDRKAIRILAAGEISQARPIAGGSLDFTSQALTRVWREVLKLPSIEPHDQFFAIGGDSLSALRVLAAVKSQMGVDLPIQAFFEEPTLQRMASLIDIARTQRQLNDESSFIFPLVKSDRGSPLFFNEVDLRLARSPAWQIPCALYAVHHWAQGQGFMQALSLAELASLQLAAIRKLQPTGPYRLAGYSFGGLVAYEIAQQLNREGERVELLFLLDPMKPTQSSKGLVPWWFRFMNNPLGRWFFYQWGHRHSRAPNPLSPSIFPKKQWPALWFHSSRLARGYRASAYRGEAIAAFSDNSRHDTWKPLLGSRASITRVDRADGAVFDEPNINQWIGDLKRHIEALGR